MNLWTQGLLCLIGLSACALSGCLATSSDIRFGLKNASNERFEDSWIEIGEDFKFSPGVLIPGATKTYFGPALIRNSNQTVVGWKTTAGQSYSRTLSVTREELTRHRGIDFIIHSDGGVTRDFSFPEGF